jgi:hypothetical protein
MPVPYQLMGTSSGDILDFECEIDVFKYAQMTVLVQMLNQFHRVGGVTVIAN